MEKLWLFLDDERLPPRDDKNWKVFRKVGEMLEFILANPRKVAGISFDHDLGSGNATGYDAAKAIHAFIYMRVWNPERLDLRVHSANPVGAARMQQVIQSLELLFDGD